MPETKELTEEPIPEYTGPSVEEILETCADPDELDGFCSLNVLVGDAEAALQRAIAEDEARQRQLGKDRLEPFTRALVYRIQTRLFTVVDGWLVHLQEHPERYGTMVRASSTDRIALIASRTAPSSNDSSLPPPTIDGGKQDAPIGASDVYTFPTSPFHARGCGDAVFFFLGRKIH